MIETFLSGDPVEIDDAVGVGRFVDLSYVDGDVGRVPRPLILELWQNLVVVAGEVAKSVRVGKCAVNAVAQSGQGRRAGNVVVVDDRAEGSRLHARAIVEIGRRLVMNDVDCAARWPAAEQRRARSFDDLDMVDAVQRVGDAAELVAV